MSPGSVTLFRSRVFAEVMKMRFNDRVLRKSREFEHRD